nr:MAG TPA: hypothetical protein [Caudoviricetes sp.]
MKQRGGLKDSLLILLVSVVLLLMPLSRAIETSLQL